MGLVPPLIFAAVAKEVVKPDMRFHVPAAILACFAAAANASTAREAPKSVALIPIAGELNEDQRRLLDAALRAELESTGIRLLDEHERLTHVRGARSLGLGCQVEASPACLSFVADVAGLSQIYVGSAENGRIRMARYTFEASEITERVFTEAQIPAPGASYVRIAHSLLRPESQTEPTEPSLPVASSNAPSANATDAAPDKSTLPEDALRVADQEETEHNAAARGTTEQANAALSDHDSAGPVLQPDVDWQSFSAPLSLGGATVLVFGASAWGLSQWVARTPLTSQLAGTKSVSDRLQLIDATETIGLALLGTGALLTTAGGGLALWPQISPE